MKVLFITYPMAFHTPGGGEMQLLAYKKYLEKSGVQVDLFDPWNPDFMSYDLVHFFSVIGGSVHLCNFIKSLGIPLVITSSLWITEETKKLYPVDEIRHQLSLADLIIGNSDIECDQMAKVLNLPRERFSTIYNGVEDIFFKIIDPEIFRNEFNVHVPFILNVGNIEPRKNQLNLVKAMESFPDKKLVLAGRLRDKQYAEEVFKVGGDQVIYVGNLDHGSKLHRSAYSACEVFCLPSTLETPGLAALEAAALKVPVAITAEGATKEYFGSSASYLSPSDIESIIFALKSKSIYSASSKIYSWHQISHDLSALYLRILNNNLKVY